MHGADPTLAGKQAASHAEGRAKDGDPLQTLQALICVSTSARTAHTAAFLPGVTWTTIMGNLFRPYDPEQALSTTLSHGTGRFSVFGETAAPCS